MHLKRHNRLVFHPNPTRANSPALFRANDNARLRLVSGTTSTYKYDGFGRRLSATVGAATPSILQYGQGDAFGANNILTETNSGVETDYAWLDDMPIAAIQPVAATISAIHTDHLGTPQKATDAAKTIVWSGNYNPAGAVTPSPATITMNLRFPGQYADATTYRLNGFRYYNTGPARYMQVDPIGLAGGMNPYVYAGNNGYANVDPWGLAKCTYSISDHTLICFPNNSAFVGPPVSLGPTGVFSGNSHSTCMNNPSEECIRNNSKGPIVPGYYRMNKDDRKIHAGQNFWRLEPDPKIPWWMCKTELKRCGFELHRGYRSEGCITADRENSDATTKYNAVNALLNKENGDNWLTVVP